MKWITVALLMLVGLSGVACAADAAPAAADPYALYYPLIATGLGSLGAFVRGFTPADGFWHKWYGHALLVLIGALAGSLAPTFEAGHVTKIALISGVVGGLSTFLSALKATGTNSAAASLLPLLLLPALLASGCASGVDGLRQTCANTDTLLTGGYQLAMASMKDAAAKGTAKKLVACFEDFVGALDAGTKVKEGVCAATAARSSVAKDTAAALTAGAGVATAIANWKTCSAAALGGV